MAKKELLSSDSSSSSDSEADGGTHLHNGAFRVNEAFARRFEHNKKREELQRLEDKHGQLNRKRKRDDDDEEDDGDGGSTSESEDEGELATEALDSEIVATINAIRSKDPRVYDADAKFYTALNEDGMPVTKTKKEKPMTLQDYHRQNLLNGANAAEEEEPVLTYSQEQEQLKRSILGEINAATAEGFDDKEASDLAEDEFLMAKEKPKNSSKAAVLDVENAEKDPETFLSNFMASRAWAVPVDRNLVPFESDDEDEERRAEEFEEAYNFRFEDPAKSNETLRSHARDLAAKYSVRREEMNPRKKRRDLEKERKEAARGELKEEKARLKKLRVEEVEEKVRRIKRAAGLRSKDLKPEDWSRFVDDEWDDEMWEREMQKRFGDEYYAEHDAESDEEMKRKVKKPKFDDDIDIKDIVPDFVDDEPAQLSLSEDEAPNKQKQKKEEKRREARRERRIIEQLVDDQLQHDLDHAIHNASKTTGFRYRETSPKSFGLTSRDILLADDSQLNEFAGLKKLAAFRDPEKKLKDQKHLGKRARLRKWRKETFGHEDGLQARELLPAQEVNEEDVDGEDGGVNIVTKGKKKRRRNKKQRVAESV